MNDITIYGLAKDVFKESNGDRKAACADLAAKLIDMPELLAPIIDTAARRLTNTAISNKRASIVTAATTQADRARVGAIERTMRRFWLDYPMIDGRPLRDCDRVTVTRTADDLIKRGQTCLRKGRFFRSIAQSLQDGETVGDKLTEDAINARWNDAPEVEAA